MHEMSIAESILGIIESEAGRQKFSRVKKVRLEIGPLAGVETEALRFSFDVVRRGTLADAASLEIVATPATAWCMPCGQNVAISQRYDACPDCGGHQLQVTAGEEMRILDLEVD